MSGQYNSSAETLTDKAKRPLQLDASGNLKVAAPTGSSSTTVQGTVAKDAPQSSNPVTIGGVYYDVPSAVSTAGDATTLWTTNYGAVATLPVSFAGTALGDPSSVTVGYQPINGNFGTYSVAPSGPLNWPGSGTAMFHQRGDATGTHVVPKPGTTGGLTPASIRTGTTGVIKASAGQLFNLVLQNTNAAVRYLHLYNKVTAPTLSTDTPVITIQLPASSLMINPSLGDTHGVAFATGIAWAYTTDNNTIPTTAATSGELIATALYK